ncbi:MAG: hypothetical protein HC933_04230 [Pleurocapsa sp. SU_196_0]|nr:hypothetical protein [Pleurocapsa sp. SU_196_0]
MATRRVLAEVNGGELRLLITEHSTVLLEPMNLEFETIEDAVAYIVMHPQTFSSEVYAALLERLESLGGGGL